VRLFFALLVVLVAVAHGVHVLDISQGSVGNTNGARFLTFSQLDRLASSGAIGKTFVLFVDAAFIYLGVIQLRKTWVKKK